jgi:hypothetical protein
VIGFFVFLIVGFNNANDRNGFVSNIASEIAFVILTVGALDVMRGWRDRQSEERALKLQLTMNAGSISNEIAKDAVHQIRWRGWLSGEDGILQHAVLGMANLQGADLRYANLQGVFLRSADLQGADLQSARLQSAHLGFASMQGAYLQRAKLQGAELWGVIFQGADMSDAKLSSANLGVANLQNVDLVGADLQYANLGRADLQHANLFEANLQGANLFEANLQGAILFDAKLNAETTLPDYTKYDPNKGVEQLDKFIDGSWYDENEGWWTKKDE